MDQRRPDAGCRLTIPYRNGTAELAILWEYDRSTETLKQLAAKMPSYALVLQSHAYRQHWPGTKEARIFFIMQSVDRLRNAIGMIRTKPAALFVRLAVVADLQPDRILKESIWWTVSGEQRSILRG